MRWYRTSITKLLLLISAISCGLLLIRGRPAQDLETRDAAAPAEGRPRETSFVPPSTDGYIGSTACAACHREISEAYSVHPMARSTRHVETEMGTDSAQCGPAWIPGRQRVLTVDCQAGSLIHHEKMFDADGALIYDQAFPIEYIVGSGQRAKAYLHRRGDLLFMSPLNWYADGAKWDLAPNYRPDDPRRFDRRVTEDCLGCHAGRIAVEKRGANVFPDPVFHETGIGCERCHGPAADHVRFHEGAIAATSVRDPIVNPAKLDATRRESVCYQCHLSAAARVLRPGRSHLDFRPGMRLGEIWAILDLGTDVRRDGRTRSVNHVQQMRDSRCFRESAGKMGCISCHDPHRVPSEQSRAAFYRQRCLECHADRGCTLPESERTAHSNSCIACHMPRRESSNMSHVVQTDHRVLRVPVAINDAAAPIDGETLTLFASMDEQLSEAERRRALGLGTFIHASRKGLRPPAGLDRYLEDLVASSPDDGPLLTALGMIKYEQGNLNAARDYFGRASRLPGDREVAMDGLLKVSYQLADWEVVVTYADRLLEIDPGDAAIHAMRGDALMNLGDVEAGIAAVRRAVALNPSSIPYRQWLIEQYGALQREAERKEQERFVERIRGARIPDEPAD